MNQHERDMQNEREIQKALAEDTQRIQSPAELDKQILARARTQAETNLRRRGKQRFGFWHYCAAASAAGVMVLSSWLISQQPDSQLAEPLPTAEQRSVAPVAPAVEEMADVMPAPALQAARAKLTSVETVDCTQLTISQALAAQERYISRVFSDSGEQKAALQRIARERALYEKLMAENDSRELPATWRVNWWQAPQSVQKGYKVSQEVAPGKEAQYTCAADDK